MLDGAKRDGFALTRLVAHMEWSLEDREGVSDLLEYEARFNPVHRSAETRSSAPTTSPGQREVLIDILRTHPMVIMGGILQENPFFVQLCGVPAGAARERRGPQNG